MRKKKHATNRERFMFTLNTEFERDAVIADWIDEQFNASESIRMVLYEFITTGAARRPVATRQEENQAYVNALLRMET